jgi:hypothetical protein
MKKKMPKSVRKYIRKEKARIRREVLDTKDQKELIDKLYKKHSQAKENDNTGNIQPGDKQGN